MKKRILWAINPFQDDKAFFKHSLKVVGEFASARGAEVEPVMVLSPPNIFLSIQDQLPSVDSVETKVTKLWAKLSKGNKFARSFLNPTILAEDGISQSRMAHALADYAVTVGAEMIAVATHGRKGVARAFLGSFAESLLHQSPLPTFVFSPKAEKSGKVKTILVPVDFPFKDKGPFAEVLSFAKSMKAKLVLFHKIDYITKYTASTIYGVPMYEGYLAKDIETRKNEMAKLRAEAEAAGVHADLILDQGNGYVAEKIISAAKRVKADLIALVGKTGPVQAAFLGSVTRQVIRSAGCPLWVLHSARPVMRETAPRKSNVVLSATK